MSFLIYGGIELAPGDYISKIIAPDALMQMTPEQLEAARVAYGLDQPFIVRYFKWLWLLLQGDWGKSMTSGVPVKDIILEKLPITMELMLTGLVISAILGCIFGIVSALNRGRLVDQVLTFAGIVGLSIPQFFFAVLAILVFALKLQWLPSGGRTTMEMV